MIISKTLAFCFNHRICLDKEENPPSGCLKRVYSSNHLKARLTPLQNSQKLKTISRSKTAPKRLCPLIDHLFFYKNIFGYLTWSTSNRSVLVRIPALRGKGTRIELRSPDPTCNPYLEMALCLAAGLDGIKKGLTLQSANDENIYALSKKEKKEKKKIEHLSTTLKEAIREAEADPFIREVLGDYIYSNYIAGKKAEWNEYRRTVSQWEIDKYMINY